MMSRLSPARRPAAPLALAARTADARRRRRRSGGDPLLYCGTNGCPTTLQLDTRIGIAACPICGFQRRLA
jgi:ribosomal protein L32